MRVSAIVCSSIAFLALALLWSVPASAVTLDLTIPDASGDIGAAFFTQGAQGAGTGQIDPFLRILATGTEMGVNSDGPYTMDEFSGTHSILVSDFGGTQLHGISMLRILLDINETHNTPLLSLDQLKIFVSPVATYNTLEQLTANATLIYDMGAGNRILLDASIEAGSGVSDMYVFLPYALFHPYDNQYLYLFSEFGALGGEYTADDGFEEWASPGDLPPPMGACCFPTGECTLTIQVDCTGTWLGADVPCDPNPCAQPTGACCLEDGTCVLTTEELCTGQWYGEGSACEPNPCTQPTGACCYPDGTCAITTEEECTGYWYGAGTVCDPNPCTQPTGACCLENGECVLLNEQECLARGGEYQGNDTSCDPSPCPAPSPTERMTWGRVKQAYR